MSELERSLRLLAAELDWPATPPLELRLPPAAVPGRRRFRPVLALALVLLVAAVVAAAIPDARSAILHWFRIGSARVEQVETLPPAPARPPTAGLGRPVEVTTAERALGPGNHLPAAARAAQLYLRDGVVSTVLPTPDGTVLLSELRSGTGGSLVKKLAGSRTGVEFVNFPPDAFGVWITGALHVVIFPATPARLAGNVLLWVSGEITYRLEGAHLTKPAALALAQAVTPP